ncbi:TetR/AcrR family transcriptional regulator [Marinactinospora thermotolerans]|uniref:Transcriptional regulator, TetR family n=1 Tax=Marinactinospora thermotolerans DSM 45154 TaxID=1122192 RepID=A0A1T4R2H1_9ACTN|nr:TetR family transcriptional regulator [Marinactinospora thermotolerans]SKA10242.1 transcriptional regulator, TetR family [Marinactinospora thermotolerans DSM 45154]
MEQPTIVTDGRRIKGNRRRRALIEATLRVIERDGVSGVSHRTVSQEARLPTSASTYYFTGLEDLLTAALSSVMTEDAERVRRLTAPGDNRHELALLFAGVVALPGHLLAEYELFLLAARRPALRKATDEWLDALRDFAYCYTDDPVRAWYAAGMIDGILLHSLLRDEKPTAAEIETAIRALLPGPPRNP